MGCTTCTEPQCLYKDALYFFLFFYIFVSNTGNVLFVVIPKGLDILQTEEANVTIL